MPRIIAMRSSGDADWAAATSCGVGPASAFELTWGSSGAIWARRAATNLRHGASAEFADIGDASQLTRITVRLLMAAILGGILGFEREHKGKANTVRFAFIAMTNHMEDWAAVARQTQTGLASALRGGRYEHADEAGPAITPRTTTIGEQPNAG